MLYINDILLIKNDIPILQKVKSWLGNYFSMRKLGKADYILGIKIYRARSNMSSIDSTRKTCLGYELRLGIRLLKAFRTLKLAFILSHPFHTIPFINNLNILGSLDTLLNSLKYPMLCML